MTSEVTMVRNGALLRLAEIFRLPVTDLKPELRFGIDLEASFVSDFRRNELDLVDDDIHDVADRVMAAQLASEQLVIKTVGDYCAYMVRCYEVKPKDVARLLKVPMLA